MSDTAANADLQVTVDRWLNTYFVPAGSHFDRDMTHSVLERIDRRVAQELAQSCAHCLASRLWNSSSDVWRIREIELNFLVDVGAPGASEISNAWGDQLALALARVLERGQDLESVLHFKNRAAYQAQFALDLTAGHASGKWYYEEFRPLEMLSPGTAIAELLAREPEDGAQTILALARLNRLDEVLSVLSEHDARTICRWCFGMFTDVSSTSVGGAFAAFRSRDSAFPGSSTVDKIDASASGLSRWAGRLLEILDNEPLLPHGSASSIYHDALRWMAQAALRIPAAEQEPAARAAVQSLLQLREVLRSMRSPLLADRLVRDLTGRKTSLEDAIAIALKQGADVPEGSLQFIAQIANGDPDWAAHVTAVLLKDHRSPAATAFAGEFMITPFAGVFLLGPELVKWNEVVEQAAGRGDQATEIASYLRYLILTKCLGSARSLETMPDPSLRLLSGCRRAGLRDGWQAYPPLNLGLGDPATIKQRIELTGCDGRCLLADAIELLSQKRTILLLKDLSRDEWVWACLANENCSEWEPAILSGIDAVSRVTGNDPYLVLCPSLSTIGDSSSLRQRAQRVFALDAAVADDELQQALRAARCISGPASQARLTSMLASSERDFSYFTFVAQWPEFDAELDLFAAFISRAALRGLARRLMGFQSSSPEFLFQNFLKGIGTVRDDPGKIEVELPHNPLLLVLQLSGLTRQTYAVPWLEGRDVCLLPPRE